jgi:hypothetical protein
MSQERKLHPLKNKSSTPPSGSDCSQPVQEGQTSDSYRLSFQISSELDIKKKETRTIQIQRNIPKDSLVINIFFPNIKGMRISVVPTDSIYILNPLFLGNQKVYFYNGNIIDINRSFKNYLITHDDQIFIITTEQMNQNTETFWRNASKNILDEKEKFALIHDQRSKLLFARNKDLALFKAESQSTLNRCLLNNLKFFIDTQFSSYFPTNLTLNYPNEVSKDILPSLW